MVSYRFYNNIKQHQQKQQQKYIYYWYYFHVILYQIFPLFFVIYITSHLLFQYFITVVCFNFKNIYSYLFFLGDFIQRIKNLRQTGDLIRHNVLDILLRCIQFFSLFDHWVKQTLWVRWFNILIWDTFCH